MNLADGGASSERQMEETKMVEEGLVTDAVRGGAGSGGDADYADGDARSALPFDRRPPRGGAEEENAEEGGDRGIRQSEEDYAGDGDLGNNAGVVKGEDEFAPLLQDLVDLHESLEGKEEARGVLYHHMRECWKLLKAQAASAPASSTAETAEAAVDTTPEDPARRAAATPLPRQGRGEIDAAVMGPGAYRVYVGQGSRRATSGDHSVDSATAGGARAGAQEQRDQRAPRADDRAVLVEANLVDEAENGPPPLLVEARPIRRRRQIAIALVAGLALTAVVVGLVVGLWPDPPSPSPTTAPIQLDSLLLASLPPETRVRIRNESSSQSLAFAWATNEDRVPRNATAYDEKLLLERVTQRFALATLFYATGGETSCQRVAEWINSTADECAWYGCSCPDAGGCIVDEWHLSKVDLSSNGLNRTLPPEVGLLSTLESLDLLLNSLTGSLPAELGNLTLLQDLSLGEHLLIGGIPVSIGMLAKLTSLQMWRNAIMGAIPSEFGMLGRLEIWI